MPIGPFELQRFVDAQAGVYATALAELRAGRMRSHWTWFVLPQLRGLGRSPVATRPRAGGRARALMSGGCRSTAGPIVVGQALRCGAPSTPPQKGPSP